jgi:hypothetical protein
MLLVQQKDCGDADSCCWESKRQEPTQPLPFSFEKHRGRFGYSGDECEQGDQQVLALLRVADEIMKNLPRNDQP